METRLATNQIRLTSWANIIRARNESGLTVKEYCEVNGLSRNSYFYWLKKVRAAALESNGFRFVEIPVPDTGMHTEGRNADAVTVELGSARIHVPGPASRDTFAMIVEVLSHAE